eukprot:Nk52_evm11s244 gene=Nk52_evmTU11s244
MARRNLRKEFMRDKFNAIVEEDTRTSMSMASMGSGQDLSQEEGNDFDESSRDSFRDTDGGLGFESEDMGGDYDVQGADHYEDWGRESESGDESSDPDTEIVNDDDKGFAFAQIILYAKYKYNFSFECLEFILTTVKTFAQTPSGRDELLRTEVKSKKIRNWVGKRYGPQPKVQKIPTCRDCLFPYLVRDPELEPEKNCECSTPEDPALLLGPHCLKYISIKEQVRSLFRSHNFANAIAQHKRNNWLPIVEGRADVTAQSPHCDYYDGRIFRQWLETEKELFVYTPNTDVLILGLATDYVEVYNKYSSQSLCPVVLKIFNLPKHARHMPGNLIVSSVTGDSIVRKNGPVEDKNKPNKMVPWAFLQNTVMELNRLLEGFMVYNAAEKRMTRVVCRVLLCTGDTRVQNETKGIPCMPSAMPCLMCLFMGVSVHGYCYYFNHCCYLAANSSKRREYKRRVFNSVTLRLKLASSGASTQTAQQMSETTSTPGFKDDQYMNQCLQDEADYRLTGVHSTGRQKSVLWSLEQPHFSVFKQVVLDPLHNVCNVETLLRETMMGVMATGGADKFQAVMNHEKVHFQRFREDNPLPLSTTERNVVDNAYLSLRVSRDTMDTTQCPFRSHKTFTFHDRFVFASPLGLYALLQSNSESSMVHLYHYFTLIVQGIRMDNSKATLKVLTALILEFITSFEITNPICKSTLQVHNLIHIPDMIEDFGGVRNIWTYFIEVFAGSMRNLMKGNRFPSSQISENMATMAYLGRNLDEASQTPLFQQLFPSCNGSLLEALRSSSEQSRSKSVTGGSGLLGNRPTGHGKLVENWESFARDSSIFITLDPYGRALNFGDNLCHRLTVQVEQGAFLGNLRQSDVIKSYHTFLSHGHKFVSMAKDLNTTKYNDSCVMYLPQDPVIHNSGQACYGSILCALTAANNEVPEDVSLFCLLLRHDTLCGARTTDAMDFLRMDEQNPFPLLQMEQDFAVEIVPFHHIVPRKFTFQPLSSTNVYDKSYLSKYFHTREGHENMMHTADTDNPNDVLYNELHMQKYMYALYVPS